MPRPRTENPDMIVAEADGSFLFWMNGAFSGDNRELVANARLAAAAHPEMMLTAKGPAVLADDFDSVGAAAALMAALPGRVTILSAPQRVLNLFPEDPEEDEDEIFIIGEDELEVTRNV